MVLRKAPLAGKTQGRTPH